PNLVSQIRMLSKKFLIESITTLSEEYIDWAGFLNDHFVEKNTKSVSNLMFKDKFYMRSFLKDIVAQPYFRLLESESDLKMFWENSCTNTAIIKPRRGAACTGIKKINKETILDDSYFGDHFMVEEFVGLKNMITCDGYAIGNSIKRFFVHDNVKLLLESLNSTNGYYLLRTSRFYSDTDLIRLIFFECEKVIKEFSVSDELTPFHFEWFVDPYKGQVVLCEVGKRFGGGDIPDLINDVYDINILKEYWQIMSSSNNIENIDYNETVKIPEKIAATFALYKQTGYVKILPDANELPWAESVYFTINIGDYIKASENIVENSLLVRFICNNEKEFQEKTEQLEMFSEKIVYSRTKSK
ncbi:carboxylate--amine ligase, partial [Streptococcus dysgalactiae]